LKEAARIAGVSTEILRRVVNENVLPKDSTLERMAVCFGIDAMALLLARHRQRLEPVVHADFRLPRLQPAHPGQVRRKYRKSFMQSLDTNDREYRPIFSGMAG
jgi:hypothetical protein